LNAFPLVFILFPALLVAVADGLPVALPVVAPLVVIDPVVVAFGVSDVAVTPFLFAVLPVPVAAWGAVIAPY